MYKSETKECNQCSTVNSTKLVLLCILIFDNYETFYTIIIGMFVCVCWGMGV